MTDISRWDRVRAIVAEEYNVPAESLRLDTRFGKDLVSESMEHIELAMACEEAFDVEIPDEFLEHCNTLGDLYKLIEAILDDEGSTGGTIWPPPPQLPPRV